MAPNPIIEFQEMTFGFEARDPLFSNLSLSLEKGIVYGVTGPSGAGKTTFLRLLNRLEEPLSGEIRFKEAPLHTYSPPELRRSLLYLQQTPTVVDGTVMENLLLPFSFKSNRHLASPHRKKMKALLAEVHLESIGLSDHAMTLSVGQLQRLCLIRGLLLSPEVLLLDEPLSALDPESVKAVMSLLERFQRESAPTILFISHKTDDTSALIERYLAVGNRDVREVP